MVLNWFYNKVTHSLPKDGASYCIDNVKLIKVTLPLISQNTNNFEKRCAKMGKKISFCLISNLYGPGGLLVLRYMLLNVKNMGHGNLVSWQVTYSEEPGACGSRDMTIAPKT